MARRSDIDWEAVEQDYRAGLLSVASIGLKHKVSTSQIKAKAKAANPPWQRDLSEAIKARAKAKIAQIDVAELVEQSATKSANQSAKVIQSAIEQASDVAAGIVIKHRASARLNQERAATIEAMLDAQLSNAVEIKDIATVAATLKTLVETRQKLTSMERQAFGLEDGAPPPDAETKEIKVTFVKPQ